MKSPLTNLSEDQKEDHSSETRLAGRSVSRGLAAGRAVTIYGDNRQFYRSSISPDMVPAEINRYKAAHDRASRQLVRAANAIEKSASSASIFDLHRTILDDSS